MNEMVGVILLGAGVLVAGLLIMRMRDPRRVFRKAQELQVAGKPKLAVTSFQKVLALLVQSRITGSERIFLEANSYLAIGSICLVEGDSQEAFKNFNRAKILGAKLSSEAEFHLATEYAKQGARTDEAVESYLRAIARKPKASPASRLMLAVIKELATVSEDLTIPERRSASALNRRILKADEDVSWAHHYLGISLLLEGRSGEALASLERGRALDPDFCMNGFWLSLCHLHLPEPNLEAAIKEMDTFLLQSRGEYSNPKREARVCREIAKLLAILAGGLEINEKRKHQCIKTELLRTIKFLRQAAALQPSHAKGRFDLGKALYISGDSASALSEFLAATKLAPEESVYAHRLALCYREIGQTQDAIVFAQKALELAPNDGSVAGLLGELHFQIDEFGLSENYFEKALNEFPSQPLWFALRIRALFHLGDYSQVLETVDSLLPGKSDLDLDPLAVHAVGRSAMILGKPLEAMAWLRTLDDLPLPRFHLACAIAQSGDYAQAYQIFSELMESAPELRNDSVLFRAHSSFHMGNFQAAEKDYWQALEGNPLAWEAYGALGALAQSTESTGTAISLFQAVLRINPLAHSVRLSLGTVLERNDQLKEALSSLKDIPQDAKERGVARLRMGIISFRTADYAIALQSFLDSSLNGAKDDDYLFYRGATHAHLGQYTEALEMWHWLRKKHPRNERLNLNIARAHYLRGGGRLHEGNLTGAIEDWSQYLSCYSDDLDGKFDLAELHFQNGLAKLHAYSAGDSLAADSAVNSFQLAHSIARRHPPYAFWLGASHMIAGAPEKAAIEFQQIIDNVGPDPRLHYHLGSALLQLGNQPEAAIDYLKIAAGHPDAGAWSELATWTLANEGLRQGQIEKAEKLFASTLDPGCLAEVMK